MSSDRPHLGGLLEPPVLTWDGSDLPWGYLLVMPVDISQSVRASVAESIVDGPPLPAIA